MVGARSGTIKDRVAEEDLPAEDRLRRIGFVLCSADLVKHKRAVTLSFDTSEARDAAWLDLHKLRSEVWSRTR